MSIKKGEYFRNKEYKALGTMLLKEIETFLQAVELGADDGTQKDLIDYISNEVTELPNHIKKQILMKIKSSAYSTETILRYIYNYILCCSGDRVIK